MPDPNAQLLRELGLDPGTPGSAPRGPALTVEEWARGRPAIRLLERPQAPADPRATSATGTENRAVQRRAVQNTAKVGNVNEELLKQLGLHPAVARKREIVQTRDLFGAGAAAIPPPTPEQRQQAEAARTYRDMAARPARTTRERFEQAAIEQGVPATVFERRLTDFEVQLRTQKEVQLVHPERGLPTARHAATAFTPIADPNTGAIIGYAKSGADSLICDLHGSIVQWRDEPVTPSTIQADDIILIGRAPVKGAAMLAKGAASVLRGAVSKIPNRVLRQLRAVAAGVIVGIVDAAPAVGGRRAATAMIAVERAVASEAVEEVGSRVLGRGASRLAVATSDTTIRAAPQALRPIAGALERQVTLAEYDAALQHVFPSHYLNPVTSAVDGIGQRAARRALANPRFVDAIRRGNWTQAGTFFHSAAASEIDELPRGVLPSGWTIQAEKTVQQGLGGSRLDVLVRGPAGEIVEYDWKTRAISALSTGSRKEMEKHAGHIATNVSGVLTVQESRSWIDFVRPLMPPGTRLPK